jgi:predicted small lipoprotein YifL
MKSNTLKLSLVISLSLLTLAACGKHGNSSAPTVAPDTTNVAAATPVAAAPVTATPTTAAPATTTPSMATPAPAPMAGGGDVKQQVRAMRLACAEEIKKFCSTGGEKPGRCLKEHESELSPGCNTARQALRAARKAAKAEKDE